MTDRLTGALLEAAVILSRAVTAASNAVKPYIKVNYEHNLRITLDDFVYDQGSGGAAEMKMGYYKGAYNGCGWIAVYNAALIVGLKLKPAQIINYLEANGGVIANGMLGTNPAAIAKLLTEAGLKTSIHYFPRQLDISIKSSRAAILTYLHKRRMHFVAVEAAGDSFSVYNERAGCNCCQRHPSIEKWLKSPDNDFKAVCLIQIPGD